MSTIERAILNDLLNGLESLAVSVDSIEAVLNRKGLCTISEIQAEKILHIGLSAERTSFVPFLDSLFRCLRRFGFWLYLEQS